MSHEDDLKALGQQGDVRGAVTLDEAKRFHAVVMVEAAALGLRADVLEALERLGDFLAQQ